MNLPILVIGNKNYSSWSLRPWLLMKVAGIEFKEVRIPLYQEDSRRQILEYSPSGKVPVWVEGDIRVWDSLAICEYVAEQRGGLWPDDRGARAHARSICAEMHSGFAELRSRMPMNCRARTFSPARSPALNSDIERIMAIWNACFQRYGEMGRFLFGPFTVADAMYAPVVLRFQTYGVELSEPVRNYADALLSLPALKDWMTAAREEAETIPAFELSNQGASP